MEPLTLREISDRLEKHGLELKLEHAGGAWLALVRDDHGRRGRGLQDNVADACDAAINDYLRMVQRNR